MCIGVPGFPEFIIGPAEAGPGGSIRATVLPDIRLLTPGDHAPKLKALLAEHLSRQTTPVDA
jgi:hypothetical protein